ncbi:E3 ubiquitin-protein ligase RNF123 isoform X1 [Vespa velutina]|uniref:E3 ubiquitin-protein ligase RNF123 isoform X1 n=1 Tax=Vespa velutina TaxID=202808 RepID=UPI001FB38FEB|nr:E3 ubiquitin-protein ligase RNF123 isoform X1 [Vespa velutina]XP_047367552.1 E3 ubiquitin-protein ligase RNF123 isoform X1 [Vespa velutina]
MEAEEVIQNIFGINDAIIMSKTKYKTSNVKFLSTSESLDVVKIFINETLAKYACAEKLTDDREGRIGPKTVKFDVNTHTGLFIVSPDRSSIIAQGNFCTMKANTALYKGKWMYELQLGSKGVMQVGWGTSRCKYDMESGVGDTVNSYAYDGHRVRKWNVIPTKYGESWLTGDIIGCTLNMDDGTIDFYRNGRHLGTAFDNISMGPGIAYFPTVSLTFTENVTAFFGGTPLRYPLEGYQAIQALPESQVIQATFLFQWFTHVIDYVVSIKQTNVSLTDRSMTVHAFLMCIAQSILMHIGPLLTIPYIVEGVFIPFLHEISGIQKYGARDSLKFRESKVRLMTCLDLLWTFLEEREMRSCLDSTLIYLYSTFRHVSFFLEYSNQYNSLILLIQFCLHTTTRQHFLKYLLFDRVRFANFIHIKPMDDVGLANVVQQPWWETNPIDPSIAIRKDAYIEACESIKDSVEELENIQLWLLMTLLDNSDGTPNRPTSRTIFLRKFKRFVHENLTTTRTTPHLQTPLVLSLCCFHRLLSVFKYLWNDEIGVSPVFVPCKLFYDGSINYSGIDRLGGVLSHLNKTFRTELVDILGPNHEVILSMEQSQDQPFLARLSDLPVVIPAFAHMINVNASAQGSTMLVERMGYFSREDRTPLRLGPLDAAVSLLELLDGIILFYHAAARKQVAKLAVLKENISEFEAALSEAKKRLDYIINYEDETSHLIQEELLRSIKVFTKKLSEQARQMAWIRAAVFSEEKLGELAWFLEMLTLTLQKASGEGNMFSFVPDFYLETLSDLCVSIRNHIHPTMPIETIPDYQKMLLDIAEFLCSHYLDPRIVNTNSKEILMITFAGFMSNPITLEALENVSLENRLKVVGNLLKPFEAKTWAQSNWILMRFWQGHGFAFRYERSPHLCRKVGPKLLQQEPMHQLLSASFLDSYLLVIMIYNLFHQPLKPYPSLIYQLHVRDGLLGKSQNTVQFLNSLLNQLNWAFSEFIGMIQEIHNISSRPERVFIESRQLKICATCFDLSVALLRVLEMFCTVAPDIFIDLRQSSRENLLSRLCQLLCQILNRMSSQTSCFQQVVLLEIPDLELIDHFPILTAVIGILLALLKEDMAGFTPRPSAEVPKVTRTLLIEPSFQISSLYFVLGESNIKIPKDKRKRIKQFSFLNYEDYVTDEEISQVRAMINYLDYCRDILPDSKVLMDDENICTICYAFPISAKFKPCNHETCRFCIDRHLLNTRECFFCKATISKVIDLYGNTLHDFSTESTSTKESLIH